MLKKILFFLLIFLIVLLQINNAIKYNVTKGFDYGGHLQYINHFKLSYNLPLANQGWELYQPPLYYFLNSFLKNEVQIKFFNLSIYFFLLLVLFIFFKKNNGENFELPFLITATLPGMLAIIPSISNEFFSTVIITTCLAFYILNKKNLDLKFQIILGVLMGLSLLSKATSFVLFFCILLDTFLDKNKNLLQFIKKTFYFILIAIIVGGWFYIRNFIYFKNPFIASVDFKQFAIHQSPGYRDINFFTNLSPFWKMDLFLAHHYSFFGGTYFSWFFDGHNNLFPIQAFSKIGILLIIMSLPIFIISIIGYLSQLKKIKTDNRILILYPILLFISYIAYNLKLPYYSTVKAIFILSSLLPFGYFFEKGLQKNKFIKKISFYYVFFYVLFIVKAFWILN